MKDQIDVNGWKQFAPLLGYSIRQAQRLCKKKNIQIDRLSPKGHIRITFKRAQEIIDKLLEKVVE